MLTSHLTPDMEVLEIGCGVGYFTGGIAKTNARVTAIDISPDFLKIARKNVSETNVTFKVDNAYKLSFPDDSFDTIVGSSVLHHLDVNQALQEFSRVLKPGGTVFFTEPNMINPQVFLQKNIPVLKKLAGDSPDETAFVRGPLKKIFFRLGFGNIEIIPFDFLHPKTPKACVLLVKQIGDFFERLPILKEAAGSLYITAEMGVD